jgi:methylated-DNA-protein-cysteine methyltransferase related protein
MRVEEVNAERYRVRTAPGARARRRASTYHPDVSASNAVPSHHPLSAAPERGLFKDRVYAVVRQVPAGRVTSYGDVAALIGSPRAARGVGSALNALPHGTSVPWWRVVNRSGRLTIPPHYGRRALQRALLEDEGVAFGSEGGIDLDRCAWEGPET